MTRSPWLFYVTTTQNPLLLGFTTSGSNVVNSSDMIKIAGERRWWGLLSPPELSAWGHFINVSGRIPKRNKLVGARLQQKPVANFSLSRHKHPETADKIQLVVMWKRLGSWTEPRDTKTSCVKLRGVLLIKRYLRIHNLSTCRSVCR